MFTLKDHTPAQLSSKWPNLNGNFEYTSIETKNYNCVAWAVHITHKRIQFDYLDDGEPDMEQNVSRYIEFYIKEGFEVCENDLLENGIEKIVLYCYTDSLEFSHVARQLEDGEWTSKMGDLEDISHRTVDTLVGSFYGKPHIYLKRKRVI